MKHLPPPSRWSEGQTRAVLLVIATVAILVSLTVLVDLIQQNKARGDRLRARLADPHQAVAMLPAPATGAQVASLDP